MSRQKFEIEVPNGLTVTKDNLPTITAIAMHAVGMRPLWVYEDGWNGTLTFSDQPMTESPGCALLLEAWPSGQALEKEETK